MVLWGAIAVVLVSVAALAQAAEPPAESPGGSYAAWLERRDALARDGSVVRLYTFAEEFAAADPVPNRAADLADPLVFGMERAAGAAADELRFVGGRWPETKAVRLDQGHFETRAAPVDGRAFTAAMWCRTNGPGAHRGNSGATNGTLVAAGNGYWDGWRVTISYPSRRIGFEIGRPQPSHSVGIATGAVADGVWHHIAVSWDGRKMRAFVDGELAAAGDYDGAYTPPANRSFRVGYADAGVGSVVLDVDELVIWRRALAPEEIFRDAYFYAGITEEQLAQLAAACRATEHADHAGAALALSTLARAKRLHPDVASAVRLRLAEALRRQGKPGPAAEEYVRVADTRGIPARLAGQALEGLRAMLAEGAGAALGRRASELLLAMSGLTPQERLELRLGLAHALADGRDFARARAAYAKLADDPAAPAVWRSVARLCEARACVLAGDLAAALRAYAAVKDIPGAPRNHVAESDERAAELRRMRAGMPARDPSAGRVKLQPRPAPGAMFYVAPDGDDTSEGTRDRPFATLERARDAIRALKKGAGLPAGGVAVLVRGGAYRVRDTFALTKVDSGTERSPIVYRAEGGVPRFDAGAQVVSFERVTEAAILARLDPAVRGKVVRADLRARGISQLGTFELGGFGSGRGFRTYPTFSLYVDGSPMTLARWPDDGYVHVAGLAESDGRKGVLRYAEDRIGRWKDEKDAWLYGYWCWDWADSYEKVASIDPAAKTLTLAPPHHNYGYRAGQRFYGVNLLCELDKPGEWYLDRDAGMLYLYPPTDLAKAVVEVPVLEKPVVTLDDVSHVAFEGLTWELGRGDAIVVTGGESVLIAGCTVRKFGGNGIEIRGGARHVVLSCDLHTLGRGGTVVTGGDRATLAPGGHVVENCHIHHISLVDHTYTPGVLLEGVGNRVAHNLIHDSASSAMRIEGNDHLVEYNEVHHVLTESDDQGGADMWGNPTYRGNVYRYNYWHDIGNGLGCGQAGIRLDDAISGVLIYGNVFRRCSDGGFGGVQIHGGKDNVVENNLFVDCKVAVSFSPWGDARWRQFLEGHAKGHLALVRPSQPPYSQRYPELATLFDRADANSIRRNVAVGCGALLARDSGRNELVDNWTVPSDPGFVDAARGNYAVKDASPLGRRPGFAPIPFGEIGLYRDAFRATK